MASKSKRARALVDINDHGFKCRCGHVFEADSKLVATLISSGIADDNEDAIAAGLLENDVINVPLTEAEIEADIAEASADISAASEKLQAALEDNKAEEKPAK